MRTQVCKNKEKQHFLSGKNGSGFCVYSPQEKIGAADEVFSKLPNSKPGKKWLSIETPLYRLLQKISGRGRHLHGLDFLLSNERSVHAPQSVRTAWGYPLDWMLDSCPERWQKASLAIRTGMRQENTAHDSATFIHRRINTDFVESVWNF